VTPMEAATAEWLTRLGVRNYAKSSVRTYAHCLALLSPATLMGPPFRQCEGTTSLGIPASAK
jgi:hypothetical protein